MNAKTEQSPARLAAAEISSGLVKVNFIARIVSCQNERSHVGAFAYVFDDVLDCFDAVAHFDVDMTLEHVA